MASKTTATQLGKNIIEQEKKLAQAKITDMRSTFSAIEKMNDAASEVGALLSKFTREYGMSRQAVDATFELSRAQLSYVKAAKKAADKAAKTTESEDTKTSVADQSPAPALGSSSPQESSPYPVEQNQ